MAEKIKVFTYGTLMQGQHNNKVLGSNAKLLYSGIIHGYVNIGLEYGFPCIVEHKAFNEVVGEVWEVDKNDLASIDMLEGYDENNELDSMYIRRNVRVYSQNNYNETIYDICYGYVWNSNYSMKIDHIVPSGKKWNEFNIY